MLTLYIRVNVPAEQMHVGEPKDIPSAVAPEGTEVEKQRIGGNDSGYVSRGLPHHNTDIPSGSTLEKNISEQIDNEKSGSSDDHVTRAGAYNDAKGVIGQQQASK